MESKIQNPKSKILFDGRVGLIGAGTMGQALIGGLLARGVSPRAIQAVEADPETRRRVARRFGIAVGRDAPMPARCCETILLAVKPQQMAEVVESLAPHVTRRHLVISIAAGITLRWLQRRLPGVPLARVMPNLPATVGGACSALTLGRFATARHRRLARAICEAVGTVVELPERLFNAITAVSGSGPAYVFFLMDAWQEAARLLGVPTEVARTMIASTIEGSLRLWQASGQPPASLIARVASKGGTTEAALRHLDRRQVRAAFIEAVQAAASRSAALSVASSGNG
jgi:pyrroline-5-carboxylate reductase